MSNEQKDKDAEFEAFLIDVIDTEITMKMNYKALLLLCSMLSSHFGSPACENDKTTKERLAASIIASAASSVPEKHRELTALQVCAFLTLCSPNKEKAADQIHEAMESLNKYLENITAKEA